MAKHKSIPDAMPRMLPVHDKPPYSIAGVHLPHWEVHDGVIPSDFHAKVNQYLLDTTWHQYWHPIPGELQIFRPSDWDESWAASAGMHRNVNQPRAIFGSDLASTQRRHAIIAELWDRLNQYLGGKYAITGKPEGMVWKDYPCPATADPNIEQGWRVYANATVHDSISLGGYVHRDNYELDDETSVTILWIASQEWYPSWGSELMLFPEDPDETTGDHQQFNQGAGQQRRNFRIGWQDEGKLITMRPGRLIIYDSRTLHITQPSRHRYHSMPNRRVVFRARKIT